MLYLLEHNGLLPYLLVALLLGLLTGAWMWRRRRHRVTLRVAEEGPLQATLSRTVPAPAAPIVEEPVPAVAVEPAVPLDAAPDDFTRMKGVGPKLQTLLNNLGVYHFHQIAGWTEAEVVEIDGKLGAFRGRIQRDRWQHQARLLAEGRDDEFAQEFGK